MARTRPVKLSFLVRNILWSFMDWSVFAKIITTTALLAASSISIGSVISSQ